MKFRKGSLAPTIVQLYTYGLTYGEIAARCGCSRANAIQTVQRHRLKDNVVTIMLPLAGETLAWLRQEAADAKVEPSEMARAMLVDAIEEAKEKESHG